MKSLIEKIFKRKQSKYNYVIAKLKPSRGRAMSKLARVSEYDIESPTTKDEMEIDNIYKKN